MKKHKFTDEEHFAIWRAYGQKCFYCEQPLAAADSGGTELKGKLKVSGTGLRPILRAAIGGQAVVAFIFESPTSADVLFGNMAPGTYDLILYDGVQEVARASNSVVVPAPPSPETARVRAVVLGRAVVRVGYEVSYTIPAITVSRKSWRAVSRSMTRIGAPQRGHGQVRRGLDPSATSVGAGVGSTARACRHCASACVRHRGARTPK